MDMHISFGKKVICTTVYVKLVSTDQLLLSEAVCVSYHPSVQSVPRCHSAETAKPTSNRDSESDTTPNTTVPMEQPRAEDLAQHVADGIILQIEKVNQLALTAVASN